MDREKMEQEDHMTVTEMRALLKMNRPAFSKKYHIPVRTLENWESGVRVAPEYVIYLLERAVLEDIKELNTEK